MCSLFLLTCIEAAHRSPRFLAHERSGTWPSPSCVHYTLRRFTFFGVWYGLVFRTHVDLKPPRRHRQGGVSSKTFGFLSFETEADQQAAQRGIDGEEYEGNVLRAEISHSAAEREEIRERRAARRAEAEASGARAYEPQISHDRAFVGNLPRAITQEQFAETFGQVGEATLAVYSDGSTLGYGFVVFEIPEHRDAFLEQWADQEFEGAPLRVEAAYAPAPSQRRRRWGRRRSSAPRSGGGEREAGGEQPVRAYVGNLPDGTTADQFRELFGAQGDAVLTHSRDGTPLHYGFVSFQSVEDRDAFVEQWNGFEHGGEALVVEVARALRPRRRQRRRPPRPRQVGDDGERGLN